jgi:hypothetical protein
MFGSVIVQAVLPGGFCSDALPFLDDVDTFPITL